MTTGLRSGEKIVFIGDSITDSGRCDPVTRPLGSGYVRFLHDFLLVREPEKAITVINTGIGGNTIEDLRNRWVDDALSHRPDWLAIKIGINDCHRFVTDAKGNPFQSPEIYAEIFDQLLAVTRAELPDVKLLLIDPFYASLDQKGLVEDAFRARVFSLIGEYIATVARMADKYGARHVRTHDIFHKHFSHQSPAIFFPNEPVHPNQSGHILIAEAVWSGLCGV